MPQLKLDHCVIHVSDWERSNAFYRDVLGAQLIRLGDGWAYRFGDTQLNCHGPGHRPDLVARLPVQPGNSDLCFEWRGPIAEAQSHLDKLGVPIEVGPVPRTAARGDGSSIYFRDPDGSLLEFISYRSPDDQFCAASSASHLMKVRMPASRARSARHSTQ